MVVSATTLSVSASLQIALCGAMALGWSPFPKMGIREAAIACILSFGLAALYFAFRMQTGGSGLHLQWRSLKFKASLFKDILGVGLISSVNATQTIATAVIITGLVGSFGTAAIAGYGLGVRLELLQITIIFAIGSVLIPMVGINIGRGNVKRARKIARLGAALAAGITGYVGVTVALWPSLGPAFSAVIPAFECGIRLSTYRRTVLYLPWHRYALYFASQGAGKIALPMLAGTAHFYHCWLLAVFSV